MKSKYIKFEFFGLCGELGWFPGEEFTLFHINIGDITWYNKKIEWVSIIGLKFTKLLFTIWWEAKND